jgi:hypothetical protein
MPTPHPVPFSPGVALLYREPSGSGVRFNGEAIKVESDMIGPVGVSRM